MTTLSFLHSSNKGLNISLWEKVSAHFECGQLLKHLKQIINQLDVFLIKLIQSITV